MDRYKMPVAVHLFLIKNNQILLLRRFNTGYEDGNYSVIAGHVDKSEDYITSMIREAKEEAGIVIEESMIKTIQVMHRKTINEERIDYFLLSNDYEGDIRNMEPNKCDELRWYSLDSLPDNLIPYIRFAISMYKKDIYFTRFGWL